MNAFRNTLGATIVGLALAACGQTDEATPTAGVAAPAPVSAPVEPPKPAPPPFDGTVTLSARLEGGSMPAVVGVTNLPDGTKLMVTLYRKQSSYSAQGKATVSGGAFRAGPFSQQGADLNPGEYTVDIGSPLTALQPTNVQAAFGGSGANLQGPLTGPSPVGGTVVDYSTKIKIGKASDAALDAAAQAQAKLDLHQWQIDSCDDRCRIVKNVADKKGQPFDQDGCNQQCVAEISTP